MSTKNVLPTYFNAYFKPRIEILPEHCIHADGIGSLLPQVVWALCEPGDGVLMAAVSKSLVYVSTLIPMLFFSLITVGLWSITSFDRVWRLLDIPRYLHT